VAHTSRRPALSERPHHDARPLDRARDAGDADGDADGVPDRLSISLAHGISFGLTGAIEEEEDIARRRA
jgi:hypothetical protein